MTTPAHILTAAAELAATSPTAERAAILANYVCRADENIQDAVLTAWRKAEGWTGLDGAFVWHLGRRRPDAAGVAAGLYRAAAAGQPPQREDEFTHLSHEDLLTEARRWKHNAQHWQEAHDALKPATDEIVADAWRALDRAKALLGTGRKAVPMDALREALLGGL